MNRTKSHLIAFLGVMTALTFVVLLLESYVFTIVIPLAPPAILSLSLAITLCLFDDWKMMFVGGTILGCCSLIVAFIIGNPVFILPWISILPRIFIGVVAFGVTKLCLKFCKTSKNEFVSKFLPYGVGAVFGVLTNTVLVLSMMLICNFVGMETVLATFMAINFPLEIVGSAILVPVLVNAIRRFYKLDKLGENSDNIKEAVINGEQKGNGE